MVCQILGVGINTGFALIAKLYTSLYFGDFSDPRGDFFCDLVDQYVTGCAFLMWSIRGKIGFEK